MAKQNKVAANLQQDYTEAEKAQARRNIGLAEVAHTGDYNDLVNRPQQISGQVQSDWAQTNENAVDFIRHKPTIPTPQTVNDAVFTLQVNGSQLATFTANSATNTTANVVVPTKTSDITNDSGFITSADLPTVNDGTLTIKLDGTNVQTFSANESTDKTANIVLPQAYAIQRSRNNYSPSSNDWPVIGYLGDDGATTVCSIKFPSDVITKNLTVDSNGNVAFQLTGVYHFHLEIPVEITHAAEDTDALTNYVYVNAAVYKSGSYDTAGWTETRAVLNRRLAELNTYWVKVDFDSVVGDLDASFSCQMRLRGLNLSTSTGMDISVHKPIGSITRVC